MNDNIIKKNNNSHEYTTSLIKGPFGINVTACGIALTEIDNIRKLVMTWEITKILNV